MMAFEKSESGSILKYFAATGVIPAKRGQDSAGTQPRHPVVRIELESQVAFAAGLVGNPGVAQGIAQNVMGVSAVRMAANQIFSLLHRFCLVAVLDGHTNPMATAGMKSGSSATARASANM